MSLEVGKARRNLSSKNPPNAKGFSGMDLSLLHKFACMYMTLWHPEHSLI